MMKIYVFVNDKCFLHYTRIYYSCGESLRATCPFTASAMSGNSLTDWSHKDNVRHCMAIKVASVHTPEYMDTDTTYLDTR